MEFLMLAACWSGHRRRSGAVQVLKRTVGAGVKNTKLEFSRCFPGNGRHNFLDINQDRRHGSGWRNAFTEYLRWESARFPTDGKQVSPGESSIKSATSGTSIWMASHGKPAYTGGTIAV